MCMICKFAYQCHIGLLKSYRYFMTYRDMIPLHLTSVILPEWKIWRIGSLPEIRSSIIRMLLGGDVAIQTQPEVDLPSKPALDGPSYFDYHISTQFSF